MDGCAVVDSRWPSRRPSWIGARVRAYADTADGDVTHPGGQGTVMNIGGLRGRS